MNPTNQPANTPPQNSGKKKILLSQIALILLALCFFFLLIGNAMRSNGAGILILPGDACGLAALILAIIGRVKKDRGAYLAVVIILLLLIPLLVSIAVNPPK
ncbi:MAG: hypothetical protein LBM73_03165 [Candidatus Nomurabacteria bacterium]|jgi:hypothetical protein|nr:hypothetical protein [Candidatus Nomurabacteria bacterium]